MPHPSEAPARNSSHGRGLNVTITGLALSALAISPSQALEKPAEGAWLKEAAAHVLTPAGDRVMPVAVQRVEGEVREPEAMLLEDGKSCHLAYRGGGPKPVVVLDFGKQSTGGYAVFTVTAHTGQPVVRLSYACHPDGTSENGCFSRESSARYLGPNVDLPILPANLDRHECYTIPREGKFIAPLVQGQERYVRVQLDTPDTTVDVDSVTIVNSSVYDRSPNDGQFLCSDERINRLWYLSTWTTQIAALPNSDAWKTVDGWLLPRKLEQAADVGLSVDGANWGDVALETTFELRSNPHAVSAAGIAFRAKDPANGYLMELGLDGGFRLLRRQDGHDAVITEKKLPSALVDGRPYHLKITAKGPVLTTFLDGTAIDETRDGTFATGRVGFYTPKEKWPLYDDIRISDASGKVLLADDFSGDLGKWQFARTLSYLADGAKRDRLIWSGDLYFAQRNMYYGFAHPTYLRDSLKMLAFNQTPEGYVQACPYPERSVKPAAGEYGPFPSDEFAAWLVPVAWEHLLYTDDTATLKEIHPAILKLLGYLEKNIGADGLFVQRPETSKHAGNLNPGDTRHRAYMNILLWGVFTDAGKIADRLGMPGERDKANARAEAIKRAITAKLWNEKDGYFHDAVETPGFGFEANALSLSLGFATPAQALRIAPRLKKVEHGKFQSLASRGLFYYGFAQAGLQAIWDHNWKHLLEDGWKGACTTTECMILNTSGWGDESHPDSTIADHFSAYLLGVLPVAPGYSRFTLHPQPVREVTWAKGLVPTPHGPIEAGWEASANELVVDVTVPQGTLADVVLPRGGKVEVNGKAGETAGLKPGKYHIVASGLPAGVWDPPVLAVTAGDKDKGISYKASSSLEEGPWGLTNLSAPREDKSKRGYTSGPRDSEDSKEWVELDLGSRMTVSKLLLFAREDTPGLKGGPACFPRDFTVEVAEQPGVYKTAATFTDCKPPDAKGLSVDLYTVIGYPSVRYIRIAATKLGDPAADQTSIYRLQFSRVQVQRP